VKRWLRKWKQARRLNDYGWACAGRAVYGSDRNSFYIKRSNWIFNLLNGHGSFKGEFQ
jgi:hypothetical protein